MQMTTESHPTDLATIGQTDRTTLKCSCGATHGVTSQRIQSPFNPALATSVVSKADFLAQRAWMKAHREHGQISQR
jgi:hypothetical protein